MFVLGWRTPRSGGVAELTSIGTAFFVAVPCRTLPDCFFDYIVTARHVVEGEAETFIRANKKGGGTEVVRTGTWATHPTEDVAATGIFMGDLPHIDYGRVVHSEFFLDQHPEITSHLGDRVYFLGLLADLPGMAERNIPMVRSGTIGALNEKKVPIRMPDGSRSTITAHLIDCRSFAGFSGSPCFAQFNDNIGEVTPLLGLMSGHFDKKAKAHGSGDFAADYVGEIEYLVNTGVGLCTPSEKITETLYMEELVEQREKAEAVERQRRENEAGAAAR